MGAATAIAVVDAGPLIHLSELGVLPLLRVFGELHVPQAVWTETAGQGRVAATDLLDLGILIQHSVASSDVAHLLLTLCRLIRSVPCTLASKPAFFCAIS